VRTPDGVIIEPKTSIEQAVRVIDQGRLGVAIVCDQKRRLVGIVTDVDVRKGILRGVDLKDPVETIMCVTPIFARAGAGRDELRGLMHRSGLRQIPVVNSEGRVVGVEILKDLGQARDTEVVIMAGGRGHRMRPRTDTVPKPMLPLSGRPLLEILIERLRQVDLVCLRIALHYKGEMIRKYFGNGDRWGVRIEYIQEAEQLGTAGALGLLRPPPEAAFLVINADLLTNLNFEHLLDYHASHGYPVTMCVKEVQFQVPFGVVELDGELAMGIEEKPRTSFHVNAGIYVLNPSVLDLIKPGAFLDMPDLIKRVVSTGQHVGCFPVREMWMDIGREEDYWKALGELPDSYG
jgi:dTDP-glucose pyrophosphorylase